VAYRQQVSCPRVIHVKPASQAGSGNNFVTCCRHSVVIMAQECLNTQAGAVIANRYAIDEKNAIIALQAILTTRGTVPEDYYRRLAIYLGRLPPYRALLVYGHAMHAIANRMDETDPARETLKTLGLVIAEHVSPEFPDQVEADPDHMESQRTLLAENLNQIASFMAHFRDNAL
jgi:hypothetical protein